MSSTTTHVRVLPISFTVGFINSDDKDQILDLMQKIDPHAWITNPTANHRQVKINRETGERRYKEKFNMLVQQGQEKPLFFKLKLKYPDFERLGLDSRHSA